MTSKGHCLSEKKSSIKSSKKGSLMLLGTEAACLACTSNLSERLTLQVFGLLLVLFLFTQQVERTF